MLFKAHEDRQRADVDADVAQKTGNRGISQMVKRHATTHDHPSQFNLTGVDGVDVRVLIT